MKLTGPPSTIRRAKKSRREMSLPEVILWQQLRRRPASLKFRHQHPAGPYELDFYCDAARLAIEVDGEAHNRGDRPVRDVKRDAWLAERGVYTLRVPASAVLSDLDSVLRQIVDCALTRRGDPKSSPLGGGGPPAKRVVEGAGDRTDAGASAPSTAFGGPPPPAGEDLR